MQNTYLKTAFGILLLVPLFFVSCDKNDSGTGTVLKNDCIKRSLGPNVAGQSIEFAYAMALPYNGGKILSASVTANIAGAAGTYMDNRSFYTNSSGVDVGVVVGSASVTSGTETKVTFTVDTCASTLRYIYIIPNEAKGKDVSFVFSSEGSTGEKVSYEMGPYPVSMMDMKLDIPVSDNNLCYISIADMAAYNAADAASKASQIDLVYLYRSITGISFEHAFVSPAATEYLPGVTLPSGVNRSTLIRKAYSLQDRHLARLQYGIYIDDVDFQQIDMSNMPNYAINMKVDSGMWIETADGVYRAYIYVNSVNNAGKSAVISMKRYKMK